MADKSRDAFRTISEVADWLGVQPHVLRFWESKFSQVKPVKRAGGRRYYRPADMQLLGGIRKLLHEDGLTIKGAQKVLREAGMAHVAAMSPPLDTETAAIVESSAPAEVAETTMPTEPEVAAPAQGEEQEPAQEPRDEPGSLPSFLSDAPVDTDTSETADPEPADSLPSFLTQGNDDKTTDGTPSQDFEPPSQVIEAEQNFDTAQPEPESATSALYDDLLASDEGEASQAQSEETLEPAEETSEVDPAPPQTEGSSSVLPDPVVPDEEAPAPLSDPEPATEHEDTALADAPSDAPAATETEDTAPIDSPRPNIVDAPDPDDSSFDVAPSTLAAAFRTVSLDDETRGAVTPLVAQLAALRDRMAAARGR